MSLLYAWALALGLAAVVPVLLHLRRRQTDRRVAFPALRYLTTAEDARSRSWVASDLLLLALRVGLVVALALAAAGPLLGRGGAGDHAPTDLALVIDNSASVGRLAGETPLFESLVARARSTLSETRSEDRVWVFPTVGAPLATGVGAGRAVEALERLRPTDGAADLVEAVRRASAALPAIEGRRREVQLLSDLQASALRGDGRGGEGAPLVVYVAASPGPNAALAELEPTGGTTVPSGLGHGVVVRALRFGGGAAAPAQSGLDGGAADEASFRLHLDGRIAGAARAPWGTVANLALPELEVGAHRGRVEVDPEGASADDTRYFAIRVVPPPAVRFFGPPRSFVSVGMETLRQAGRLAAAGPASVAVLEGTATSLPEPITTAVLIPPDDPVDLPVFNQGLARLGVPWTARVDRGRGDVGLDPPGAPFSLAGVRVRMRYGLQPSGGGAASDTILLRSTDGAPWLVRTEAGGRAILLLASPLVPAATDLPAHPAMIPFLEALLVQWSHLSGWPPSDFEAGAPLALPAWAGALRDPDGASWSVEGGSLFTPLRAGIYEVSASDQDDARAAEFAVNVPASELDPTPVLPGALEELFGDRPVHPAGPDERAWSDGIFRARRGRDVAPWLAVLALALVGAELFLATPGRSRRSEAGVDLAAGSESSSRVST